MPKHTSITPELGETTEAVIEYSLSTISGKLYVTTDLELKGRGVNMSGDGSDHKRGKKTYHVTENAFDKLKLVHDTCYINSL